MRRLRMRGRFLTLKTPMSDQDRIYPHNISKKNNNKEIVS